MAFQTTLLMPVSLQNTCSELICWLLALLKAEGCKGQLHLVAWSRSAILCDIALPRNGISLRAGRRICGGNRGGASTAGLI
jgi:hypothetical protein